MLQRHVSHHARGSEVRGLRSQDQENRLIGATEENPLLRKAQQVVVTWQKVLVHGLIQRADATQSVGKDVRGQKRGHAIKIHITIQTEEADAIHTGDI
jgi:hypothetical protein